ncbi:MAG: Rieske 2Fe-2S domain-containing protein [Parvularculaceae bacterium]|nr:Rieske 2Fe-2S domain-containing protein [Parvularculaceae bacterium]
MLINNWYVAAESADVKVGEPFGVKMLGCDFVLFRKENGEPVCLSNVCCHRGAALCNGSIKGDNIACPFHGWQFDQQGKCVSIPSMGPEFAIPARAKIDSYPVVEKYDWVWVFLGDLPEDRRPPVPELLPEYVQTDKWRTTRMTYEAGVNWTKAEENNIDTAHLPFVHSAFGARQDPRATIVPIDRKPYGARVERERTAPKASQKQGVLGDLLKEERTKTRVSLEFSVAGLCHRIHPEFRPGMAQVALGASTPIDPRNTRFFGLQARNYAIEPEGDQERLDGRRKAMLEDVAISTKVRPPVGPTPMRNEVLVKADEMETLFRHYVLQLIEMGWELDYKKMQQDYDHKVYVIPSPARREDPHGWVHEAAPTTRPRKDDDAWPVEAWVG